MAAPDPTTLDPEARGRIDALVAAAEHEHPDEGHGDEAEHRGDRELDAGEHRR